MNKQEFVAATRMVAKKQEIACIFFSKSHQFPFMQRRILKFSNS